MTKLIEFKNQSGETLRALLDKARSKRGVIFVHGFERTSIEKRFKLIVDELKGKVNFWRFDMADCGLSDGEFKNFTVDRSAQELAIAVNKFRQQAEIKILTIIAHSVGGCISLHYLLNYYKSTEFIVGKLVLFAPALNQQALLRYWFTRMSSPQRKINWHNYQKYLDEKEFLRNIKLRQRLVKNHILSNKYFLENYQQDYNEKINQLKGQELLVVHGDKDEKVPLASNNFEQVLIVKGGDHDLQRPDMVKQWLKPVINFIQKK